MKTRIYACCLLVFSVAFSATVVLGQEFAIKPKSFLGIPVPAAQLANTTPASPNSYLWGDIISGVQHDAWGSNFNHPASFFKLLQDQVTVRIDHDIPPPASGYKYRFSLLIRIHNDPSNPSALLPIIPLSQTLDLEYDPAPGAVYKDVATYSFTGAHSFDIQIDKIEDISNPQSPVVVSRSAAAVQNFTIETKVEYLSGKPAPGINANSYSIYNLNRNAVPVAGNSALEITWETVNNTASSPCPILNLPPTPDIIPNIYELEWTYIEDYVYNLGDPNGLLNGSHYYPQAAINYSFKNNATRIRTSSNSYRIPLTFEHGYIIYRLRVLRPSDDYTSLTEAYGWTLPDNGVTVAPVNSCFPTQAYAITPNQVVEGDGKNWNYSLTLAEDGKFKHAVSYFDGLFKNRQSLTQLNSLSTGTPNDYILAQETVYDKEGRPSIKTLPLPVMRTGFQYLKKLLIKNTGGVLTSADFDNYNPAACGPRPIAPLAPWSVSTAGDGLGNWYYSPQNTEKQIGMKKYIPDANGFPYVQTIFSPENSNMIRWQGGAGNFLQPWNGHAAEYNYVRADQTQLDRLFGTEAGYEKYYPKEILTDQNGQTSFTIRNPKGQVIATGLSGFEPGHASSGSSLLDPLPSQPTPILTSKEILGGTEPIVLDRNVLFKSSFYSEAANSAVSGSNGVTLDRSVTLTGFTFCKNTNLMPVLQYKTTIADDCGYPVYSYSGSVGQLSNSLPTITDGATGVALTAGLSKQKYTAKTDILINRDDLRNQIALEFDQNAGVAGTGACFTDKNSFIYNKIRSSVYPCSSGESQHPQSECDRLKKRMMEEMWPGAKYGEYAANPNTGTFVGYMSNSIFTQKTTYTSNVPPGITVNGGFWAQQGGIFSGGGPSNPPNLSNWFFSSTQTGNYSPVVPFYNMAQYPTSGSGPGWYSGVTGMANTSSGTYYAEQYYKTNIYVTDPNITGNLHLVFKGHCFCQMSFDETKFQFILVNNTMVWNGNHRWGDVSLTGLNVGWNEIIIKATSIVPIAQMPAYFSFYSTCNCTNNGTITSTTFYNYQSTCIEYPSFSLNSINYGNDNLSNKVDIHSLPPQQFINIFNDQIAEALLRIHPEYCKLQQCSDNYSQWLDKITSYSEAVKLGVNTRSGLVNHDPKKISGALSVSQLGNIVAQNNPLVDIEELAFRQYYCGSASKQTGDHCADILYHNSIITKTYPSTSQELDKYWEILKALYIGNRNTIIYKSIISVSSSCSPCSSDRLTLKPPPAATDVLNQASMSTLSTTPPQAVGDVITAFNSASTSPNALQTEPSSIYNAKLAQHQSRCDAIVQNIVDQLKTCNINPVGNQGFLNLIDDVRDALSYNDLNGKIQEITPGLIGNLLHSNLNITFNDLCHPLLIDYAAINNYGIINNRQTYVYKEDEYFKGLSDFINRPSVWNVIVNGGSNTFAPDPANLFEQHLLFATAGGPIPGQISFSASGSGAARKLSFGFIASGTPVPYTPISIYLQANVQGTLASGTSFTHIPFAPGNGVIGTGTAVLNTTVNSASSGLVDAKLFVWTTDMAFTYPAQSMNPANTITCVDIKNAITALPNFLQAPYNTFDIHANHPLYRTTLANYLNFIFKRHFTGTEYEQLMNGCALSDQVALRAHKATVKVDNISGTGDAQDLYDLLSNHNPRFSFNSYNDGSNGWIFLVDLEKTSETELSDALQVLQTGVNNSGGTITYMPATPANTSNVVVWGPANGAISSLTCPNGTSTSVTYTGVQTSTGYPNPSNQESRYVFTIPITQTTPQGIANELSGIFSAVNSNLKGATIFSDYKLYRSADYALPEKQTYLSYIYGLPAGTSRELLVNNIAPANLVNQYSGKKISYDETYCSGSYTDLYLQPATISSSRLNLIFNSINAVTSGYIFDLNPGTSNSILNPSGLVSGQPANTIEGFYQSDHTYWYRYFDSYRNLYNLYIKVPEEATEPDLLTLNTNSISIVPSYDGDARKISFTVKDPNTGIDYECTAYCTGLDLAQQKIQDVVLYTPTDNKPCLEPGNCEWQKLQSDIQAGLAAYDKYRNEAVETGTNAYMAHLKKAVQTTLKITIPELNYHYTLYSYDLAGNLIRTVSPQGCAPLSLSPATQTTIDAARDNPIGGNLLPSYQSNTLYPSNSKVTQTRYNSRNQKIWEKSPDGGETYFFYDKFGRLTYSQNSKQRPGGFYSYWLYDALNRVEETGEAKFGPTSAAATDPTYFNIGASQNYNYNGDPNFNCNFYPAIKYSATDPNDPHTHVHTNNIPRSNVVRTVYDDISVSQQSSQYAAMWKGNGQDNLRNRISAVMYYSVAAGASWPTYEFANHFSYDAVGNVKTLIQDYPRFDRTGMRYARVDYDYDYASGKVNALSYNRGRADQFYHRYGYDADNRITKTETSTDGVTWDIDAEYAYYPHGPLAETRLGDARLQSMQYAYTIQGWLKSINGQLLDPDNDMGADGKVVNSVIPAYPKDLMAHSLDYFAGDYDPINSTLSGPALPSIAANKGLFNGNIVRQSTGTPQAATAMQNLIRTYQYDQLNRLKSASNAYATVSGGNLSMSTTPVDPYGTSYAYDADGNITHLTRRNGTGVVFDDLSYNYLYPGTRNWLGHVTDPAGNSTLSAVDIDGQAANNYYYDGAGNLIKDGSLSQTYDWNHYGKLTKVNTVSSPNYLFFKYGASGQRYLKATHTGGNSSYTEAGDYYVRDAAGNILATYKFTETWSPSAVILTPKIGGIGPLTGGKNLLAATTLAFPDAAMKMLLNSQDPGNATWVQQYALNHPVSAVLRSSVPAYEAFIAGTRGYLDSLLAPTNDQMLIDALQHSMGEEGNNELLLHLLQNTPASARKTVKFLCAADHHSAGQLLDYINYESSAIPDDCDTAAKIVWNVYDSLNQNASLADNVAGLFRHLSAENQQQFLASVVADYDNERRNAGPVTQYDNDLATLLAHRSVDMDALFTAINAWPAARTSLNATVPVAMQAGALYNDDAEGYLTAYLDVSGALTQLTTALAEVVENPDVFFELGDEIAERKSLTISFKDIPETEATSIGTQRIDLAEHHLYGSSRLGVKTYPTGVPTALFQEWIYQAPPVLNTLSFMKPWWWSGAGAYQATTSNSWQVSSLSNGYSAGFESGRLTGQKSYELTDHLGNVLVTLLDRKSYNSASGQWEAEVATVSDPYPFGMQMEGRSYSVGTNAYRFGYNGKEKIDQINGNGNFEDYGFRMYDNRLGRFISVDPLTRQYPMLTPYQFASNSPILGVDLDGLEFANYLAIFRKEHPVISGGLVGIHNSLSKTWGFVSSDMWKAQTWKGAGSNLGTLLDITGGNMDGGNDQLAHQVINPMVENFKADVVNGDAFSRSKYFSETGTDILTAYVASEGVSVLRAGAMSTIRMRLASEFYAKSGFTAEAALSHMEGIDFSKPLRTTTLNKGTVVQQWVGENGVGSYFTPLENGAAKNLGISYEGRSLRQFTLTEDVKVLESTTREYKGRPGGGTQYFNPELKNKVTPND